MNGQTEKYTMVISKIIIKMDKVYLCGPMVKAMMGVG